MKITVILFFEGNTEDLVVQLATYASVTDDRTKARDEQYLEVSNFFHVIHYYQGESGIYNEAGRVTSGCRLQVDEWRDADI